MFLNEVRFDNFAVKGVSNRHKMFKFNIVVMLVNILENGAMAILCKVLFFTCMEATGGFTKIYGFGIAIRTANTIDDIFGIQFIICVKREISRKPRFCRNISETDVCI